MPPKSEEELQQMVETLAATVATLMARLPRFPGVELQLLYEAHDHLEEQKEDREEVAEASWREETPVRANVGSTEASTDQPADWLEGRIAFGQGALALRLVKFI